MQEEDTATAHHLTGQRSDDGPCADGQKSFSATARIAIIVCTPLGVLADILSVLVGFGHHE